MGDDRSLRRFSCFVIYNGGYFRGWEGNDQSVKVALERALRKTLGGTKLREKQEMKITCAGRTDNKILTSRGEQEMKITCAGRTDNKILTSRGEQEMKITCAGRTDNKILTSREKQEMRITCAGRTDNKILTSREKQEMKITCAGRTDNKILTSREKQEMKITCAGRTDNKILTSREEQEMRITCAGRTDRGVHALGQRIHFDLVTSRSPLSLEKGINFYLKEINPNCQVHQCKLVDTDFNVRFSAESRCYRYYLMDKKNILLDKFAVYVRGVNWQIVDENCKLLEGYYDISCFCPKKYDGRRMRTVISVKLKQEVFLGEKLYFIEVRALGFAHHQVRFMVGALLYVGQGLITKDELLESIRNKKRIYLAPARGLFLFSVAYGEEFIAPK
jgi:tRNA pseudouridine(38-40) synthase